jgi:DNA polymerase III alpha subunit
MKSDKFGNPIYEEQDLINLLYLGNAEKIDQVLVENSDLMTLFESYSNLNLRKIDNSIYSTSVEDFDIACQTDWFIPDDYKNMDIEGYLVNVCPKENYQRLIEELEEFRARNMLMLLKTLKYLVDTLKENNILWGVGRGSSVASYVLFLLEVHRIDSIKYNLDWREFLR